MNTRSIDFRPFVEWDNSPFVLFDHNGKIVYLNSAAEILMGYASPKDIYQLATENAPQNYGYKTTPVTLSYHSFNFYAISVGYDNDEEISIRLYHAPRIHHNTPIEKDKMIETDINVLLEANIALFRTKNTNRLTLLTDQDIPPFKIDQNSFSKLLRKTLDSFRSSDSIQLELKFKLGEQMFIGGQKSKIVSLDIKANGRYADHDKEIVELAEKCHIAPELEEHSISFDIPMII